MLDRIVSVEQAAIVVGVPQEWLRGQVNVTRLPDGGDGVRFKDALDAAEKYPRNYKAEERRMMRLRAER